MNTSERPLESHVLRVVNHYRLTRGMRSIDALPPGVRDCSLRCPLARATSGNFQDFMAWAQKRWNLELPGAVDDFKALRMFITTFDRGRLPWLIDGEEGTACYVPMIGHSHQKPPVVIFDEIVPVADPHQYNLSA